MWRLIRKMAAWHFFIWLARAGGDHINGTSEWTNNFSQYRSRDSSVQITSCDTCLAYLAKRWGAVLALLLVNCTCDHLNPLGKQSTSCIIWPTRDDRLFFSSKADMTDRLSPSTTISLKPHSNANSTTCLHARVSASSQQDTSGPLPESAAS